MSELSKIHSLINSKVQKQSTDRSIEIARDLLERFDCLELLDTFVDSIEQHSQAVAPQRYLHNDRAVFND